MRPPRRSWGHSSQCGAVPMGNLPPGAPLTHSPGKGFRTGWILPSQNLSYLAGDHTDGPNWARWTHRQLGVMMHRMLPINRAYCRAEASQADAPDRDTGGGPAKRRSSRIKRRETTVRRADVGKPGKIEWSRFVGQQWERRGKNNWDYTERA